MDRPSKVEVRREFLLNNVRYFQGLLPEIPVKWVAAKRWFGSWTPPDAAYPHGLIKLSSRNQPHGWGWRGILLHEMVHAWLYHTGRENGEADATILEDHSHDFVSIANVISVRLGIPLVNEHDAWAWPWGAASIFNLTETFHE